MWKQLSLPRWKEYRLSYPLTHILLCNWWCLLCKAQIEWMWSRESPMNFESAEISPPLLELRHRLLYCVINQEVQCVEFLSGYGVLSTIRSHTTAWAEEKKVSCRRGTSSRVPRGERRGPDREGQSWKSHDLLHLTNVQVHHLYDEAEIRVYLSYC